MRLITYDPDFLNHAEDTLRSKVDEILNTDYRMGSDKEERHIALDETVWRFLRIVGLRDIADKIAETPKWYS